MADMMAKALEEQAAMQAEMDRQMASLDMIGSDSPTKAPATSNSDGGPFEAAYQGNEEEQVCAWVKDLINVDLEPTSFQETLKSGVVLCELVNRVSPKSVKKINSSEMPFAQRENIQAFCDAVKALGVKDINNFAADDLYEAKNMKQVMICILALGKRCWVIPGYSGPCLGPPENETGGTGRAALAATSMNSPVPARNPKNEDSGKKYKWDVKAGGSYVPQVPSVAKKEAQQRDSEQHRVQRKWEVKFAPQLATATRKVTVTSSDIQDYMNQFSDESQLRTAMGGSAAPTHEDVGSVPVPKPAPMAQRSAAPKIPAPDDDSRRQQEAELDRQQEEDEEEEDDEEDDDDEDDGDEGGDTAYRGVPPAGVVEGLMMMLTSPDATEKAKAAAALCNICSETDSNRELVVHAGGLPSLIDMLKHPSPEVPFMQSAAAACICNLAANINSKEIIATSGALEVLVQVLRSDNQAAAAQAAGALWSLCVDNDQNKQRVADAGAIPHLIGLLHAPDTFAQSQSAGALSECSIRNDNNKRLISEHGAILPLVKMLRSQDLSVQRLSSCALCNVCANHEANKRQAREVPEVLSPVAGAICNLSMKCAENKAEFIRPGATDILRHLVTSPIPSLHGNALAALEQLELG